MIEVLRQEKKFLIDTVKAISMGGYLSQVMMEDANNKGDGYLIRSLYFDDLDNKDFFEKEEGIETRRKIRLRNYGAETDFALLEMKQKQGQWQKKRSLRMAKADAVQMSEGNYSVLLNYEDSFAAECYALMHMYRYIPRTVVEYRRRAFIAKENKIRVTIDSRITATESCYDIFSPALLQQPVLSPHLAVLEVKYNGFLLSYIKDLIRASNGSELSVSKYCLGRKSSMQYVF